MRHQRKIGTRLTPLFRYSHQDVARLEVEVKKVVPVQVVDPCGDVSSVLQRVTESDFLRAISEPINVGRA